MLVGKTALDKPLSQDEICQLSVDGLDPNGLRGKRVLVIMPDHTRTAPLPMLFRMFVELLAGQARQLNFLIALGTHPPMPEEKINELIGVTAQERQTTYARINVFNHRWDRPEQLAQIGTIPAEEIEAISGGLLREEAPILLNRMILDYDQLILCGPVFPHEVVGFSGGNKYLFPGVASPQIINLSHWLGALITNPIINGTKMTPVRRVIDRAASVVPVPRLGYCFVVDDGGLRGLFIGPPEQAWSQAADLSGKLHIVYRDRPFKHVLSAAPGMYDDIWTAGKCMYKLEPVVADGGELIIYAPHIDELSYTHGHVLDEVGYHVRDYFAKQWGRFRRYPWGVLAHSTHVKGIGQYENGQETPRVHVVLATRIPEQRCRKINLGYMDPDRIDPSEFEHREDDGVLYVPKAGEQLYRLKNPPAWQRL